MSNQSILAKIYLFLIAAMLLVLSVYIHQMDARIYFRDIGPILQKSISLVDKGIFIWKGNGIYRNLTLGPLAHLLMAIPLLISRKIQFLFYFQTLMSFLSAPLFYAACRQLRMKDLASTVATSIFLILTITIFVPIKVDNTTFLPFFLALYFYLLARSLSKIDVSIVFMWASIGLCMQLQMSTILLIPATIVMFKPKIRQDIVVHAIGLFILTVMYFHIFTQLFDFFNEVFSSKMLTGRDWGYFFDRYEDSFHPIELYFNLFIKTMIFTIILAIPTAIIILSFYRRFAGIRAYLRNSRIVFGGGVLFLLILIVVPFWCLLKAGFAPQYLLQFLPFIAAVTGGIAEAGRTKMRDDFWVYFVVTCSFIFMVNFASNRCPATPVYYDALRLNDQVAVAEKLREIIIDRDLENVAMVEQIRSAECIKPDEREKGEICFGESIYYQDLCLYLYPDLKSRFQMNVPSSKKKVLLVWIVPSGTDMGLHQSDEYKAPRIKVDQFNAGLMSVSIYLSDWNEYRENGFCTPCS
jgi:hypothetical protein